MTYKAFIEDSLAKDLIKKQKPDLKSTEKLILRAQKDLETAKANLSIDEGIAYAVSYLAMMRSARAFMLLKGFRPSDGYQHKTVVEFMFHSLGKEFKEIAEHFDRMRRKRNIFTYEIDISISKTEADNAFDTAVKFVNLIKEIIKKENPQIEFKF
ncbi:MAG TPA: HEPN domain-containing protein [Candidatus Wujingus californicus]|uniref:HEPN domain-containing protein n=1 Tax=Candidatus Wujingus californicus TaxID=3367618 RepID=UPI001DB6D0F2|nr:HEPN domain-containing protein [Planctomycetota bacterium]MDO8131954.1 HEPN domain-containing protein [Candidatus Brocadiales bacterium]